MSLHTYRYGESRNLSGLSIGVARHPPRGIRKEDRAARGYFDLWLPILAPSPELIRAFRKSEISWKTFAARYKTEMKRPEPRQVIALLAAITKSRRINLGCFCADAETCHRSLLAQLIAAAAQNPPDSSTSPCDSASPHYTSSPCYLTDFPNDFFG